MVTCYGTRNRSHTHAQAHVDARTHARTHARVHTHTNTHARVHTHTHAHTHTHRRCAEAFVRSGGLKTFEEIENEIMNGQKIQGTGTIKEVLRV